MTRDEVLQSFSTRTPVLYRYVAKGMACAARAYIAKVPTKGRGRFRIIVSRTDGSSFSRWADPADLHPLDQEASRRADAST